MLALKGVSQNDSHLTRSAEQRLKATRTANCASIIAPRDSIDGRVAQLFVFLENAFKLFVFHHDYLFCFFGYLDKREVKIGHIWTMGPW